MITSRPAPWLAFLALAACNNGTEVLTDTGNPITTGSTTDPDDDDTTTSGSSSGGADSTSTGQADSTSTGEGSSSSGEMIEDMGCPECSVLVDDLEGGRGLTLYGDYLYWTDQDAGDVGRVHKDGGDPEVLASNQASPYGLGVNDDYLYWTTFTEMGTVQRLPLDGGPPVPLAADAFPRFLQVVGDWVYWCSFDDILGRVRRVPTTGLGEPPETLVSVGSGVADLEVVGDQVFFTAHLPPAMPGLAPEGLIYAASSLVPTDEADLTVLADEQAEPWGIAQYRKTVFWINGTGDPPDLPRRVLSIPTVGGDNNPASLVVQQMNPWGIAVDEQYVYWTDYIEVKAVPHEGGDIILLADLQNVARSIIVDEASVYWITKNRVLRRPKP